VPSVAFKVASAVAIVSAAGTSIAYAQSIVARAPTGTTPEAEKLLAASAEPRRLSLQSGDSAFSIARQSCGRLTPTYVRLLQAANKPDSTPKGMAIIPACFVVRPNQTVEVRSGETWGALANRTVGVAGRITIGDIFASNEQVLRPGPITNSASVAIPDGLNEVSVPITTEAVVYKTKSGVDAESLAMELSSALAAPTGLATTPTAKDEFRLNTGIGADVVRKEICPAVPRSLSDPWPFSLQEIALILARNTAHLSSLGSSSTTTVVVVVDNGIDGIFSPNFPEDDFDVSVLEKANPADNIDQDRSGFSDDVVGTNIYDGGQPFAFLAAPMAAHGTMMASLALGGKDYRAWWHQNRVGAKIKVRAISIVKHSVVSSQTGNQHRYGMPTEALEKAVEYATGRGLSIFNLSVSTPNRIVPIEDALYNRANLLLVVAAGNDASNLGLGKTPVYPAVLSNRDLSYRGRVITVAAHGRNGCLSGFSARGAKIVDLAAPGEDIVATGIGGIEVIDEGTSQATALVSFTAAHLRAAGVDQSRLIKDRLIATVDLGRQFSGTVRSEGSLNVVKALSIFDDLVVLKSEGGRPFFGKLQATIGPSSICPTLTGDNRTVLKVSQRVDGGDPSYVRVLLRDNNLNGELEVVYCEPSSQQIQIQTVEGNTLSFAWSDVADLVPRM
jgi:hypothetical protein